MTDRELVLTVLGMAAASFAAVAVPWWVASLAALAVVVTRWPPLLVVVLVMVAGTRANDARAALDGERPGEVTAGLTVLSDPIVHYGAWRFDVRRGVERDVAELPREMAEPQVGERLSVRGIVGLLPAEGWVVARHLRARFRVTEVLDRRPPIGLLRVVNGLRSAITTGASSLGDQRPLFTGIVMGDDRGQPSVQIHRFRVAGLSHLLAVSGQNVAFVLVLLAPALAHLGLRGRWVASIAALGLFVLVTRAEPSVLRAAAMALVAATTRLRGRAASPLRILCVAVICLTVVDPLMWRSVGFQLSVSATAALILVRPWLVRRLPGPRRRREAWATVLAAQVGTMPLLLMLGSAGSVASLAANLVAVPVAGAVMVWGLGAGVVSAFVPAEVAALLHLPTRAMLWWIDAVARLASSPRWPLLGAVLASTIALGVVSALSRRPWVAMSGRVVLLGCVVTACLPPAAGSWRCARGLEVHRDATAAVVVVASGRATETQILACLARHRLPRIDLLVLTSSSAHSTRQAAVVRDATRVGAVLAHPAAVRGASAVVPGRWRVGATTVVVSRREGRLVVGVG
ncbi:MAG: ComEC/Rec2 family competence protein [Microthrixaceae bacterium]|nr:ComEC/Rec2 family competence protein [Microthrixaceae bacterium]